jgi:hypothetical protein
MPSPACSLKSSWPEESASLQYVWNILHDVSGAAATAEVTPQLCRAPQGTALGEGLLCGQPAEAAVSSSTRPCGAMALPSLPTIYTLSSVSSYFGLLVSVIAKAPLWNPTCWKQLTTPDGLVIPGFLRQLFPVSMLSSPGDVFSSSIALRAGRAFAVGAKRSAEVALQLAFLASASITQFTLTSVLFINVLYYLLSSRRSWLDFLLSSVLRPVTKDRALAVLSTSLQQVLFVNVKVAVYHFLFTFLVFTSVDAHFSVSCASLAALGAVLPLFPVVLVVLPAAIEVGANYGVVPGAILILTYWQCLSYFTWYAYSEGITHPFVLGLSIIAGMVAFGVQGAIFGPLLVSVLLSSCVLLADLMRERDSDVSHVRAREPVSTSGRVRQNMPNIHTATSRSARTSLFTPVRWTPYKGIRRRIQHTRSAIPFDVGDSVRREHVESAPLEETRTNASYSIRSTQPLHDQARP